MLRIIAGVFRHRRLQLPDAKVSRPTMDKIREAIFSSISEKVPYSTFLDLFAGSGAIGLEALSRGARQVYFNERDKSVLKTLQKNIAAFDPQNQKTVVLTKDYQTALAYLTAQGTTFDLVYLDPPYGFTANAQIVAQLKALKLLSPAALVLSEQTDKPPEVAGFTLKIHRYGKKFVGTYTLVSA